jgi:hypothetical protein
LREIKVASCESFKIAKKQAGIGLPEFIEKLDLRESGRRVKFDKARFTSRGVSEIGTRRVSEILGNTFCGQAR